jgi:hypothetical protein
VRSLFFATPCRKQLSLDDGYTFTNVIGNIKPAPAAPNGWLQISRIEPSHPAQSLALIRLTGKARDGKVKVEQFPKEAPMTIEINRPETEALIQQRLERGHFRDVDELLAEALGALQKAEPGSTSRAVMNAANRGEGQRSLVDVCAMVKGLTDDVDFSRNPFTGRPVNLS